MKCQTPTLDDLKTKSELTTNDDYPLAFYEVDLHIREYGMQHSCKATTLVSSDVKKLKMSIENNTSEEGISVNVFDPDSRVTYPQQPVTLINL